MTLRREPSRPTDHSNLLQKQRRPSKLQKMLSKLKIKLKVTMRMTKRIYGPSQRSIKLMRDKQLKIKQRRLSSSLNQRSSYHQTPFSFSWAPSSCIWTSRGILGPWKMSNKPTVNVCSMCLKIQQWLKLMLKSTTASTQTCSSLEVWHQLVSSLTKLSDSASSEAKRAVINYNSPAQTHASSSLLQG